jgi:hypothetical protein
MLSIVKETQGTKDAGRKVEPLALNRKQVAHAINSSPATVDRLVKRGLLCPSRATRRPLFAVTEIERFLRETSVRG